MYIFLNLHRRPSRYFFFFSLANFSPSYCFSFFISVVPFLLTLCHLTFSSYESLLRRNQYVVTREAKTLIWPHAAAYGLQELIREEQTLAYRQTAADLRDRIRGGKLSLTEEELADFASSDGLVRQVLTHLSDLDFGDLPHSDRIPWMRSFAAMQVLSVTFSVPFFAFDAQFASGPWGQTHGYRRLGGHLPSLTRSAHVLR